MTNNSSVGFPIRSIREAKSSSKFIGSRLWLTSFVCNATTSANPGECFVSWHCIQRVGIFATADIGFLRIASVLFAGTVACFTLRAFEC